MARESHHESKTAIVTGAARGIGAAIASRLSRDGFSLALVDRNDQVLRVADTLPAASGLVLDVSAESAGRIIADFALDTWGAIDVLVNNAAAPGPSASVESVNRDDLEELFGVNVFAVTDLCQAAIPPLVDRGGVIVNVGSLFGDYPVTNGVAYSMSKSAIKNLTQVLALELGPRGVRVNAVAPGYILTDMHMQEVALLAQSRGLTTEQRLAELRSEVPLGRHGTPEDVADVVSWLVSDDSRYVHGQMIAINGGLTFS